MVKPTVLWLDEPSSFEFIDGVAHCSFESEGRAYILRARPSTLVISLREGAVAYANFMTSNVGNVIRMKKKRPKH